MNTSSEGPSIDGEALEISPYAFHLLSQQYKEDRYTLSFDFEWDTPPWPAEIDGYIYEYTREYALSRWMERVLFWFGVPWTITPAEGDDWAWEKIIHARWWSCPIYFVEDSARFDTLCRLLEWEDALVVYIGGIDIRWSFLPFVDQIIEKMIDEKEIIFKRKELAQWVPIETMLREAPMIFSVSHVDETRGVSIDGSRTRWHTSFKIMQRIEEWQAKKPAWWKKGSTWSQAKATTGVVWGKVRHALRL